MSFSLNMDISELKNIHLGSKKPKAIKYPTKRTINLAMKEDNSKSRRLILIGSVVGILVLVVAVKFGVIDQYARLRTAQAEYDAVYAQRVALEEKVASYNDVEQEYRSYSRDWMTNDTTGKYVSVDRLDVLDMLERVVFYKGVVTDCTISGMEVNINMAGMNLQEVSEMFVLLQEEPLVGGAVLRMASTSETAAEDDVSFSLTITLTKVVEEVAE